VAPFVRRKIAAGGLSRRRDLHGGDLRGRPGAGGGRAPACVSSEVKPGGLHGQLRRGRPLPIGAGHLLEAGIVLQLPWHRCPALRAAAPLSGRSKRAWRTVRYPPHGESSSHQARHPEALLRKRKRSDVRLTSRHARVAQRPGCSPRGGGGGQHQPNRASRATAQSTAQRVQMLQDRQFTLRAGRVGGVAHEDMRQTSGAPVQAQSIARLPGPARPAARRPKTTQQTRGP